MSLALRLSLKVVLLLVPLQAAVGLASYFYVAGRDRDLLDEQLQRQAFALRQISAAGAATETAGDLAGDAGSPNTRHDKAPAVGFQYWNRDNTLGAASPNLAALPLDAAPAGFADRVIDGRTWRVFTALSDGQWIRVAQRSDLRDALARTAALQVAVLLGAGLPIVLVVLGAGLGRGFAPVATLAEQIARCVPGRSGPIGPGELPREFEPIVASVNALLAKCAGRPVVR